MYIWMNLYLFYIWTNFSAIFKIEPTATAILRQTPLLHYRERNESTDIQHSAKNLLLHIRFTGTNV